MLQMTSADLSISLSSLRHLFLSQTTGAWNVVSMEEVQYSIMNQQHCTFRIFFFFFYFPSSQREVTLMWMGFYSVLFCLDTEMRNNVHLGAGRPALCFFISPSHCFPLLAEETSQFGQRVHRECSHLEWFLSHWLDTVPSGDAESCKPFGLSSCLLTLWMSCI